MDRKIRTIVVGVAEMQPQDPTLAPPGEDPVLAPAAALAERLGARLYAVHALERPHSACECVSGDAALQLCAFSEKVGADLLVVGATRRDGIWHNFLGSTAERVLQRSTIPVLVVRHPFRHAVRRVLLTTDLSEFGPALHEAALDAVERLLGSESYEPRTLLVCWYDSAAAAHVSQEFMNAAATRRLHEFLDERQRRAYPIAGKVRIGNPSTEILREAGEWKADLLVLGTHGRWNGSTARFGSTAAAVLRGSSCNVLVIPVTQGVTRQRDAHALAPYPAAACFPGTEEHPQAGVVLARD
jgi:universal stress protein E